MKRKGYADLDKQIEADKRWIEKNRNHRNYLSNRGQAKTFIRKRATLENLENLRILIDEREQYILENE